MEKIHDGFLQIQEGYLFFAKPFLFKLELKIEKQATC